MKEIIQDSNFIKTIKDPNFIKITKDLNFIKMIKDWNFIKIKDFNIIETIYYIKINNKALNFIKTVKNVIP